MFIEKYTRDNNSGDGTGMKLLRILVAAVLFALIPRTLESSGWWKIYFTVPETEHRIVKSESCESGLINIINGARTSFYGAFYEISSPGVITALIRAARRGVDVRLVTEHDTARKRKEVIAGCIDAGIDVVTDRPKRRGLMHNKFAVIDGNKVWTGSYNPTTNDSTKNNNNAILIRSARLSDIFHDEFMEMHRDRIFGNRRNPGPLAPFMNRYYVKMDDADINIYFSPDDNIERILLRRIEKARSSIHFMAFSFTSDGIGDAMIRKFKEGVHVFGLFEGRGSRGGPSEYIKMKVEGLPVKLDHNRNLMHHKVIVIDRFRVITGSYNFSRNADRYNDENILIIDNAAIAGRYLEEFDRLYR